MFNLYVCLCIYQPWITPTNTVGTTTHKYFDLPRTAFSVWKECVATWYGEKHHTYRQRLSVK